MSKTRIEWTDYSLNPIKGLCPVNCQDNQGKSYCFARRLYQRFGWNPEIRYDQTTFFSLPAKSCRVFVGSTMELFGPWIKDEWIRTITTLCAQHNEKTFIFLTKRPGELSKYNPWPQNCWVGCSVDCAEDESKHYRSISPFAAIACLKTVQSKVKFISFEPLLNDLCSAYRPRWWADNFIDAGINWLIVGQATPPSERTSPKPQWIHDIRTAAIMARTPIFEKNNLQSIIPHDFLLQEWPDETNKTAR